MLLTLLPLAHALPTLTDAGIVLTAPATGPFARGIGAPTVAWDGTRWVMYFEGYSPSPTARCAKTLSIGRATSPDGRTWTLDETPVLLPASDDETSPYHCGVTQPAVVYDGTTWHLFFSASGAAPEPPWTWNKNNGVSYATSTDGTTFTVEQAPTPLGDYPLGDEDWFEPDGGELMPTAMATAVRINDKLWMLYEAGTQWRRVERVATFDLSTRSWNIGENSVSTESFSANLTYSPGLLCLEEERKVQAVVAGFDSSNARKVGTARSDDLLAWSTTTLTGDVFRVAHHLEPVLAGDATVVYYSKPDTDGRPAIGYADDGQTWGTPKGRVCTWEEDTGGDSGTDSGQDSGTDSGTDSGDSGGDSGTDSGGGPLVDPGELRPTPVEDADTPKEGCGCGAPAGPGAAAWLVAAALARRRRRG